MTTCLDYDGFPPPPKDPTLESADRRIFGLAKNSPPGCRRVRAETTTTSGPHDGITWERLAMWYTWLFKDVYHYSKYMNQYCRCLKVIDWTENFQAPADRK